MLWRGAGFSAGPQNFISLFSLQAAVGGERAEDLAEDKAAGEPGCGVLVEVAAGQLRDHGRGYASTIATVEF